MAMGVKEILEWARGEVDEISAAEMKAKLDQGEIDLVLDVREPGEYGEGHIPGAINVPRGVLEIYADATHPSTKPELSGDPDAQIAVYCQRDPGFRSVTSAATLRKMGYKNAVAVPGGLKDWTDEGLPVEND